MKKVISFEDRIANPGAELANPEKFLTNSFQVRQEMAEKIMTDPSFTQNIRENITADITFKQRLKKYFPNLYRLICSDEEEYNKEAKKENHLGK